MQASTASQPGVEKQVPARSPQLTVVQALHGSMLLHDASQVAVLGGSHSSPLHVSMKPSPQMPTRIWHKALQQPVFGGSQSSPGETTPSPQTIGWQRESQVGV
jgi:hypothetical protein